MKVEIFNTAELTGNDFQQKLAFDLFTKEQAGVYGVICPEKETIDAEKILDYPMPERCKEIAKETMIGEPMFYKFEVWHADRYEIKDPIMLGRARDEKNPTYFWYDKCYLLARWGEELEPFSELKKKAIEILREKTLAEAIQLRANLNALIDNTEVFCKKAINNGVTSFNINQLQI